MPQNNALGIGPRPLANIEPGMLALLCHPSHKDSIVLGTELVGKHFGER